MPSKKFDTTWKADPHTIAKITILEAYLHAWFQIMGRSMSGQDIIYVDGFAGPGEYTNYSKGSPIAALDAARLSLSKAGQQWRAGDIHCIFIEPDEKRFLHLKKVIDKIESHRRVKVHLLQATFAEGLLKLKEELPHAFSKHCPLFVFIDPFGATGVPFASIKDILKSPCSEVLLNFDADGIARIYSAAEDANSDSLLNKTFGDDRWKSALTGAHNFKTQCRLILNLYKQTLRSLPNIRYEFAFEMSSMSGSLNYYLVFASQHHLGLEKMKEAMKKVDQTGNYHFSDANIDQQNLFRFDKPEDYSPLLFSYFQGKTAIYDELRDYALNETPFINPKSMLKDLEEKDLIHVNSRDEKRRKGTFNEEKIINTVFKGGMANGH